MKPCFIILYLVLQGFSIDHCQAQTQSAKPENDSTVYCFPIDIMPEFPGGEVALMKFIKGNTKSCGTSGRVVLTFMIDTTGSVKNIQVLRKLSPSCDAEAVRVIGSMPKWKPGKNSKGKPVEVQYNLPIDF